MASVLCRRSPPAWRTGDGAAIAAAQSRGFELAIGLTLPSTVAFACWRSRSPRRCSSAAPSARATYRSRGRGARGDLRRLAGHALEKVFGAVSFAHEDTRTPMLAALAGLASAVSDRWHCFPVYGHVGVAARSRYPAGSGR
jgi:putative peptidoglycan lipid II flippase